MEILRRWVKKMLILWFFCIFAAKLSKRMGKTQQEGADS